jgi:hypothetical protein
VGLIEGVKVGTAVGTNVGEVGITEGTRVGRKVGAIDGLVGREVVGATVGEHETGLKLTICTSSPVR